MEQLHLPGLGPTQQPGDKYLFREADSTDKPHFLRLWKSYLEDHQLGSHLLPSKQNVFEFLNLQQSYCWGSLKGTCQLAFDPAERCVALALGGEDLGGLRLETRFGKTAMIWGVYVDPDYRQEGLAARVLEAGRKKLQELGFESVVSQVLTENKAGLANAKAGHADAYALSVCRPIEIKD